LTILDRYILRELSRTVFLGLLAFIAVFISLDMVENVDDFVDSSASVLTISKYYVFQIPHIFTLTLPVAVLISCLFTVGQMARHSELVAIKASGIRFGRTVIPLLFAGFLASIASLAVSELVEPAANAEVRRIKSNEIERSGAGGEPRMRNNISYRAKGGFFYFAPEYDTRLNVLKDVVVERSLRGNLMFRVNAEKATWKDSTWVFSEAWVRWFNEDGDVEREAYIPEGSLPDVTASPADIVRKQRQPEEMGFRELSRLVTRIEESGGDPTRYRVGLNMKISFPFTNLIVILIGAPLSARLRRGGMAVGMGMGLALTFIYYGFIRVGQALGEQDIMPVVLAAWLGNIAFAACGIYLIFREERH
jgi:lipopolysaccharide export system permease protein